MAEPRASATSSKWGKRAFIRAAKNSSMTGLPLPLLPYLPLTDARALVL